MLDWPISEITAALAAAGTDDDRPGARVFLRKSLFGITGRDVPAQVRRLCTDVPRKPHHRLQRVFACRCGNPLIGKQPLEVPRARLVESYSQGGGQHAAEQVGAHGCVHAKRYFELPAGKLPPDVPVCVQAFGLIEGDKLDVSDAAHQGRLGLADDPRDTSVGPVILKVANYRERVAGIADRRKSKDANIFGRRVCEQVRQVDNKGRNR